MRYKEPAYFFALHFRENLGDSNHIPACVVALKHSVLSRVNTR